jgi:hypothetical protein
MAMTAIVEIVVARESRRKALKDGRDDIRREVAAEIG